MSTWIEANRDESPYCDECELHVRVTFDGERDVCETCGEPIGEDDNGPADDDWIAAAYERHPAARASKVDLIMLAVRD